MKPTLAEQKEVEYENPKPKFKLGLKHLIPWAVNGILALLAAFFKFVLPGYSFTALVLVLLICIIAFYSLTGIFIQYNPIRRLRRLFTLLLAIGLLVVGVTEYFIIKASRGNPEAQIEYMVVLGAKVREDGPSVSLWDRIYAAADYMKAHPDVICVVSGGQGPDEHMTEAQAMFDELVKLGIDPSRIWQEDQATSTWENLNFSLNLIEEKTGARPEKIGVVSSEYHLFRASLFARANEVDFVGIPAATSRLSQKINHFMREVAGVWHYLILGGQYDA